MFDQREQAEEYKVRTGDSLKSLAERIGTTWQKLAEFNWGTREPRRINDHLADDVGCTRQDARGNYIFDDSDDPGKVLLPVSFTRSGLAARQIHTIHVKENSDVDRLIDCFGIPGATFRFGRSFIRPSSSAFIVQILRKAEEFPDTQLCVFGHTDSADDPRDNKRLSERRAWALWAILVNDPQTWVTLRDHARENWDEREFRRVHEAIGSGRTSKPGKAEFDEYFTVLREGLDALPKSRFLKEGAVDGFMGCGEFNHLVKNARPHNNADNQAKNEPNRRVMVFFFDAARPPRLPCQYNDIGPCQQNGAREDADLSGGRLFSCHVYDRIGRICDCEYGRIEGPPTFDLRYEVKDPRGTPITQRNYELKLSDESERKGTTDDKGLIIEFDVPPGEASLKLEGFSHIDEDLTDDAVPPEWGDDEIEEGEDQGCYQ